MILAFYLGFGLAFALLFLNAPQEVSGPTTGDPWHRPSVPLLASTIVLMGFWVVGARVVFSLPLDLRANWIFRVTPFRAGRQCLSARRRALLAISVAPAWAISAAALLSLWPWRPAAVHLAILGCLGVIFAEFSFSSAQKIPFACSYLPGRSNLHLTFWLWIYIIVGGIVACALGELQVLESAAATAAVLAALGIAALLAVLHNNRAAGPGQTELRFEEEPPDRLLTLDLS
jgi:hypothetical protein